MGQNPKDAFPKAINIIEITGSSYYWTQHDGHYVIIGAPSHERRGAPNHYKSWQYECLFQSLFNITITTKDQRSILLTLDKVDILFI